VERLHRLILPRRFARAGDGYPPLDRRPPEEDMFAVIAAVIFALILILDLAKTDLGSVLTTGFLTTAGFLCIALHLAGAGGWRRRFRRR